MSTITRERRAQMKRAIADAASRTLDPPVRQGSPAADAAERRRRAEQAWKTAMTLGTGARDADDFAVLLGAAGLLPGEKIPRPPKGAKNTVVNYERPGR